MFFLQMSGYPGSGKSTLAKAISRKTGAVVVDHDIVKSALMASMESRIDPKVAGKISYDIDWALVEYHLSSDHSVILDSPCLYPELLEKGSLLSRQYKVAYKYVECFLSENNERDRRLRTRQRMMSQVSELPDHIKDTVLTIDSSKMKRPTDTKYIIVDTARPIDAYINEVMAYLNE